MKNITLTFFICVFGLMLNGSELSDSLKHLVKTYPADSSLNLLIKIANSYSASQFDSTITYCNKAIKLATTMEKPIQKAIAIKILGSTFFRKGDTETAMLQYDLALDIFNKNKAHLDAAKIYNNKGLIYINIGENKKGLKNLNKAMLAYEQADRKDLLVAPLINIGLHYYHTASYAEAKENLEKAKEIAEEFDDINSLTNALSNLGAIHKELGNYKGAIKNYNAALANFITYENQYGEASIYLNLGVVYEELEQYDKAIEYTTKSILLKKQIGAEQKLANSFNKLGNIYCDWGKYDLAIDQFYEAISIEDKNNDNISLAHTLSGLAEVYIELDMYAKALDNFFEALKIFKKANHNNEIGQLHRRIGFIYSDKYNEWKTADKHFQKAEEFYKTLENKRGLSMLFYNMGKHEYLQANYDLAANYFKNSIELIKSNNSLLLYNYTMLGLSLEKNKEFEEASLCFNKALAYKDSTFRQEGNITNLKHEAIIYADRKKLEFEKIKRHTDVTIIKKKSEAKLKFTFIVVIILILIAVSIISYLLYKYKKTNNKLHKQQVDNEIQRKTIKETNLKLNEIKSHTEKISGYKSEFLANISHEIRTPLNAITGYLNLLQKQIDPENKNSYINNSLVASGNLGVIINDLLDISKIEAGKMVIEKTIFNPILIVTQSISVLKLKAEEKNIAIELHFDPLIPDKLIGDSYRLNQILTNLINNAIKFSNSDQDVSISVTFKTIGKQCELTVSVLDQGIGIEQDQLQCIFDSFSQTSSNIARNNHGTGLGLAIVKRLIELQNGHIEVNSKINDGSKFTFTINYEISKEKKSNSQESLSNYKTDHLEKLILLVEDNEINQELAKDTILSWGLNIKVDVAENGREAIEFMENNNYNLILMDIQMPEMDGHEATLHIRNKMSEKYKNIPIIGMTAHALPHEKELAIKNGMNEYIIKPFNPEELKQKLSFLVFNQK